MRQRPFGWILLSSLLLLPAIAAADDPPAEPAKPDPFANIKFEDGPIEGKLENLATVKVPEGMAFIGGRREAKKFIEATENLPSDQEVGIVVANNGEAWWVDFEYDPIGYVKDDEQGKLDADAILESLKSGTEAANADRKRRGWAELHVVGWHTTPRYNPTSHNLEWATKLTDGAGESVNYNVRVLGRRGVMSVTLIAAPDKIDAALPKLQTLLAAFTYTPDQAYSSYQSGDKVAEYGLTALVVGGVLATAAKTGLLAKFWKVIVAAFVALGAGIKKLFSGRKTPTPTDPPPAA